MTNETLVSWSRLRFDGTYQDPAKMRLDALGMSWTGTFPGQSPYVPGVIDGSWSGQLANLWSPNMDLYAHNDALQFSDKLTRLAGAHALKFGAAIERLQKQVIFPSQSTFAQALHGPGVWDCALAVIIWHEMAHLDGGDEREAQRQEELLWQRFVLEGRIDRARGLNYLALLHQRADTTRADQRDGVEQMQTYLGLVRSGGTLVLEDSDVASWPQPSRGCIGGAVRAHRAL